MTHDQPRSFFLTTNEAIVTIIDVLTGLFFVDIVLRFVQVYYAGSKQVVTPKEIALHYLQYASANEIIRTYFALDLIASVPLYHLYENLYWLRLLRVLRFDNECTKIIDFLSQNVNKNASHADPA